MSLADVILRSDHIYKKCAALVVPRGMVNLLASNSSPLPNRRCHHCKPTWGMMPRPIPLSPSLRYEKYEGGSKQRQRSDDPWTDEYMLMLDKVQDLHLVSAGQHTASAWCCCFRCCYPLCKCAERTSHLLHCSLRCRKQSRLA